MPRGLAVHLAERTVPAEADAVPRPAIHLAQRAVRAEAMMIMSPAVHLAEGAVPAEAHVVDLDTVGAFLNASDALSSEHLSGWINAAMSR